MCPLLYTLRDSRTTSSFVVERQLKLALIKTWYACTGAHSVQSEP